MKIRSYLRQVGWQINRIDEMEENLFAHSRKAVFDRFDRVCGKRGFQARSKDAYRNRPTPAFCQRDDMMQVISRTHRNQSYILWYLMNICDIYLFYLKFPIGEILRRNEKHAYHIISREAGKNSGGDMDFWGVRKWSGWQWRMSRRRTRAVWHRWFW